MWDASYPGHGLQRSRNRLILGVVGGGDLGRLPTTRRVRILALATLTIGYAVAARVGLGIDAVSGFATVVWPPTGIALGALVLGGLSLWPGIFVGAFFVNLAMGAPALAAIGIACGNTLEAVLAAVLLGRVGFSITMGRVRDVIALVVVGALGSTIVSSAVGVLSLSLAGIVPAAAVARTFAAWWIGDLNGALVVGPLLLAFAPRARSTPPSDAGVAEGAAAGCVTAAVGVLVFGLRWHESVDAMLQPFLLFPPLIWIALRFGPRGVAVGNALVATLAIIGTSAGRGPFVPGLGQPLHESLATLQLFMAVLALSMLILGAAVAERAASDANVRESYALLRAMLDGSPAPVFAKDRRGRYLLVNHAAAEILGRPASEVIGRDDQAIAGTPRARANALLDAELLRTGQARTSEETFDLHGRGPRTLLWTKGPYRDSGGEILGLFGMARDITDQKQAQKALEDAVTARDEFLFIAGHELRTPLCSLTLELGRLERFCQRTGGDPGIVERVGKLLRQTDRLNHLISSVLEVSNLSTGRLTLRPEEVELGELVREVADRFTETAARSGCNLMIEAAREIRGRWDRLRLEQIVTNLISNALKYGAGKPIEIALAESGGVATIAVRDHGVGVAPEDVDRIFGPFERAVSARHYGGLGLGLFISRQIAEAHGGAIRVGSAGEDGATFTVELPGTLQGATAETPAAAAPSEGSTGRRVPETSTKEAVNDALTA